MTTPTKTVIRMNLARIPKKSGGVRYESIEPLQGETSPFVAYFPQSTVRQDDGYRTEVTVTIE